MKRYFFHSTHSSWAVHSVKVLPAEIMHRQNNYARGEKA